VCKTICDPITKDECCTEYRECQETCYKWCHKKVWKQYCYNKTVCKKCGEWVTEQCCEPKKMKCVEECRKVCFDPCSCKTECGAWHKCRSWCCEAKPEVCCKKVWKSHCITEQVPCTRWVKETVHEKVPYTVCRKVPYTVVKKVTCNVQRSVRGAYVDEKGVGYECEGPGRCFKEGAFVKKQISTPICRTVTEIVKKPVTTYNTRCVKGAYVDEKGCGHECDGPGRTFKECAWIEREVTRNVERCVTENVVEQVPYCSYQNVTEECVKQVPYKVCKMVPYTCMKKVPCTTCEMVTCNKVCKVPYTVTECVPCTICKKVAVCEPYDVCVKTCRKVPVTVCEPKCEPKCEPCKSVCEPSCDCKPGLCCHKECRVRCYEQKCGILGRFFGGKKSSCESCGH